MEADIVSRVGKLEAELQRLKYLIKAKTLHEYVIEELHRVKAIDELEINGILSKLIGNALKIYYSPELSPSQTYYPVIHR